MTDTNLYEMIVHQCECTDAVFFKVSNAELNILFNFTLISLYFALLNFK